MNRCSVKHDDRRLAPVLVIEIKQLDEVVHEGAEALSITRRLADREVTLPVSVDGSCQGQTVPERLRHMSHVFSSAPPA